MMRSALSVPALLLCASVLSGCATHNGNALAGQAGLSTGDDGLATDLDSGVRKAQLERVAGHYDRAIHTLSQLMLVASDDPRVVGEYGKTLTEQGRGQEAVQFLTRATELQGGDWTLYSALGVAYDELGQESEAAKAYERALVLRPHEASVLNNYALSCMMANEPAQAQQLMAEAEKAGGASDPKIARNIAMVKSLAANAPAPAQAPAKAEAALTPAPQSISANLSPRPVAPAVAPKAAPKVVMEKVPVDPLAGPVKLRPAVAKPRPAVPRMKPAVPEEKADGEAADARPAVESGIPALRQTASAY